MKLQNPADSADHTDEIPQPLSAFISVIRGESPPLMAIIVSEKTKVLVQGITGEFGGRHTKLSLDYGSAIVAGVTPGKGGQFFEHGSHRVPIFRPRRPS